MNNRKTAAAVVVCLVGAAAVWMLVRYWPGKQQAADSGPDGERKAAPAEVIGPFTVGVASLAIDENEHASRVFRDLVEVIPDEPAVWANLGVVRLRLGDLPGAEEALEQAAELAPRSEQIIELQSVVDDHQGEFQRAIERLRALPEPSITVLFRKAELLGRTGSDADIREQLATYDRILELAPNNLVAAFGRARILARAEEGPALKTALEALEAHRESWTPEAEKQFASAAAAVKSGNFRSAATHLAFLQNLSLKTPAYQAALAELGGTGGSIGRPVEEFLVYRLPAIRVADADLALQFEQTRAAAADSAASQLYIALVLDDKPASIVALRNGTLQIGEQEGLAVAGSAEDVSREALCAVDLNGDFRQDLAFVNDAGLQLWMQNEDGQFAAHELTEETKALFAAPGRGVWSLDFEADGDMDLLVARAAAAPQIIRNNGDGGFAAVDALASFPEPREIHWGDFDGDGDGDLALLDAEGRVQVAWNHRSGAFAEPIVVAESAAALTYGDLFSIGKLDLIVLESSGAVRNLQFRRGADEPESRELARWSEPPDLVQAYADRRAGIHLCDLDNNGAMDLVASALGSTQVWLGKGDAQFEPLDSVPALFVTSIVDVNQDGRLDLVGNTNAGGAAFHTRGSKNYHWQSLHTRTLANLADGRLNSFGIGGHIEIRAEQLAASAPITSPRTHFGLGQQDHIGVARIVWPNGVAQVEFELEADQQVTATQRLKGSCPWVFARDGETFRFVKDFIWRSPLGMRINSQETAGVEQTEDWILIPGELLSAVDGAYEFRITAELWETHFFDHISLLVVDHPGTVHAYVDERFVPIRQPKLEVIATSPPEPFVEARDESGRDVLDTLAESDGQYVADFPLGRFQGIAEDHWVEFQLPETLPNEHSVVLIGEGWIYPTDSSLNVAIAQGNHAAPRGLVLEQLDEQVGWRAVSDDLGFPAGKNKTVVIPLPPESLASGARRYRLRTNLEVYWDRLGWALARPDMKMETRPAETLLAELRYHGFSKVAPPHRRKPDIPQYDELWGPGARWRDLEGYYTRFGDVRELLHQIDDRYVIMNAGDEFVLRFAAPEPPPAGWTRDFVLIGDGWVKDGDFNTANSTTVHPLPTHALQHYGGPPGSLEEDPVFQSHSEDWQRFHTRFITPTYFQRGLMGAARDRFEGTKP